MKQIGTYAGVPVALEWRDGQQIIVFMIPNTELGRTQSQIMFGLAEAISDGNSQSRVDGDTLKIEIPHTEAVDQRIMTLIDILIAARYEHPTMVQLLLCLDPTEAHRLEAMLS